MRCLYTMTLLLLSSWLFLAAKAQNDPFLGPNRYPQYRNLSGLAGGGFGVDAEGYPSLVGPTAYSTPIAYVPGHDQIRILGAKMSFTSLPDVRINHSNGSGVFLYGHTFGRLNVAFSDLIKSSQWDQALNLQIGWIPSSPIAPAFSVGVQDIFGHGGAAGEGVPGDAASTRSVFAVATWCVPWRHPLYVSAGIGSCRFRQGFASASMPLSRGLRGWIEYDGFGFNEGLLWATWKTKMGLRAETDFTVGFIRGRYFLLGTGIGF